MRQKMTELRRNEVLCDVWVEVGGITFPAHRAVLASSSDYMRALFEGNRFADSAEAHIQLQDMSATAFEHILNLVYLDKCRVEGSDLMDVLEAASRLQCTGIIEELGRHIAENVGPDTCLNAWESAERMGLKTLEVAAKAKALSSFDDMSKMDSFKDLSVDHLSELLADDCLAVESEEEVYTAVIAWARAQPQPIAADDLEKVMTHVRFPFMSEQFIDQHVETEQLLLDNLRVMVDIQRSFKEKLYGARTKRTVPRKMRCDV